MTYLDRMYWVKTSTPYSIKMDLTETVLKYDGSVETLILYEEKDGLIGVPRNYGIKKYGLAFEDRTVYPHYVWKQFNTIDHSFREGQERSISDAYLAFRDRKLYGALLEAPCGSGKTVCGLSIASLLKTPTLILVHKENLAAQWHKDAKKFFGLNGGHFQEDIAVYKNLPFVTAMAQTLYSRKETLTEDFINNFGLVIYDEGHRYSARTFEEVSKLFPARYRLGVSATWRRADGTDFIWGYHIGKVESQIKVHRLAGTYSQLIYETPLKDNFFTSKSKVPIRGHYITAIAEDTNYNNWLVSIIVKAAVKDRSILVLSDRINQLEYFSKILKRDLITTDKKVIMYTGGDKLSKLEEAKKCDIILSTYAMFSEGTDIPKLDTLFFATPRSDIEQSLGRIQRPVDKKPLRVIDPVLNTNWNKHLAKARLKHYLKAGFIRE